MAAFCKQCSLDVFGKDFGELKGATTKEAEAQGLYALVLCEGCGPIQVDSEGACICTNCLSETHGKGKLMREAEAGRTPDHN